MLVVDPIDGTRPAMAGFESCCVSVAAAPLGDGEPTMGDVDFGCVVEIKSGAVFAGRARGRRRDPRADGASRPTAGLSANDRPLQRMFWTFGFRGRPGGAADDGARAS